MTKTKTEVLKDASSHFAFGKNWASYAALIGDPQIEAAKAALMKLIPVEAFNGKSFLDIGCGSGLHALAAEKLGVSRIVGVDIDPDSVATSRAVLSRHNVAVPWQIELRSVFELDSEWEGAFDIVYSWGVLHHTGSMWEAVTRAARMVAPQGLLAIALYRRTRMDPLWTLEKRLYAHAPKFLQGLVAFAYTHAFRLALFAKGVDYRIYLAQYKSRRGMDYRHDVHDWLGGYPYESALAHEVDAKLVALGFKAERVFARPTSLGIFGSGCDEYVYRRLG